MKARESIDNKITNTLQSFLGAHKNNYFIIGGHAAAYNLSLQDLPFRKTKDFDIVIVSEATSEDFCKDLVSLLISGGYKHSYKSSIKKRVAYRFESPANIGYPEIIEFFVREGVHSQSLDNRFAKLDIVIDDDKLSAMVLNQEIYEFALKHLVEINELMFVDKPCLIALKSYAYFENLKLFREGKVSSNSYKKHLRDILRIIGSMTEIDLKKINDLPIQLKESMEKIIEELTVSKQQFDSYLLSEDFIIETIKSLLGDVKTK